LILIVKGDVAKDIIERKETDMPTVCRPITEPEILLEVLAGGQRGLPQEVAQWILTLHFSDAQQVRMLDLADRGNAGTLSAEEKKEIQSYARAGDFLSLWHAKARLALRNQAQTA
jgi:hypothetical protein